MFGSIKSFFKKKCPTVGEASIKSELIDYHSRCGVGRSELLNDEALVKWITYKRDVFGFEYKNQSISTRMIKIGTLSEQMDAVCFAIKNNWMGFRKNKITKCTLKQASYIHHLIGKKGFNEDVDIVSLSLDDAKNLIAKLIKLDDVKVSHEPIIKNTHSKRLSCDEMREKNRSALDLSDQELIEICLKTKCRSVNKSKNAEALKLHKIGYNMGNISIALFNNPGFLATKTNKAGSRYLKLTKRLVDILPKREYTD